MNDILGKVFSVLLCAWLMFLYPLNVAREENRQIEQMYLYQETVRFLDNICNTGVISDRDMQNYLDKISHMNTLYQVNITHESLMGENKDKNEDKVGAANVPQEETKSETFFQTHTQTEIFEQLREGLEYQMNYNDFIKIVIYNSQGNMSVCYGGSIKAVYSPKEESR